MFNKQLTETHPVAEQTDASFCVVSFYGGAPYYYEKAQELRDQCDALGLEHDIVEIKIDPEHESWASVCRRKIPFYLEQLKKHKKGVLWVDVDSHILRDPAPLLSGNFDLGAFMRGFQYLPNYNPAVFARTLHPGYLFFRYSEATLQFLEECVAFNETCDLTVTDDYILEEMLRTSEAQLRFMLFSPRDIRWNSKQKDDGNAYFRHGDSGNVREFKDKVEQHLPRALEPKAQKAVLMHAIQEAAKKSRRVQVMALRMRVLDIDPEDGNTYAALLQQLQNMEETDRLQEMLRRGRNSDALRPYALRFQMVTAFQQKRWNEGEKFYAALQKTDNKRIIDFATSRRERALLDRRAEERNITDKDRLPLFWWEEPHPGNLGDIINPYVVEGLSGIPPKYAPAGVGACAIGSIIKFAKSGTPVWGSGSPREDAELAPDADYRAVRGPYTRDLVLKNGGTCPKVYGDPAWFLPVLFRPDVPKTHKTGVILHFTHESGQLNYDDAIRSISIRRVGQEQIEDFLTEMLSCERIVSTSLHGVIIANAYGIPAMWGTVSGADQQIHGDGIKFKDYFASVGLPEDLEPVDLSKLDQISDTTLPAEQFLLPGKPIDLVALAQQAPFTVQQSVFKKAQEFVKHSQPDTNESHHLARLFLSLSKQTRLLVGKGR